MVGPEVGEVVGPKEGSSFGEVVGPDVGDVVGSNVGGGRFVGSAVSASVGSRDGLSDGDVVGPEVGEVVGPKVGRDVVGLRVGCGTQTYVPSPQLETLVHSCVTRPIDEPELTRDFNRMVRKTS